MKLSRSFLVLSSVSGVALLVNGAAYAQPAATAPDATPATTPAATQVPATAPTANAGGGGIAEIVVTAQRREQRLQDVPIAVTAVQGNTLAANRVQNSTDLNGLVPGLFARPNTGGLGSPSFSLRGVQAASSSASQDRETSQYLDGVYIGSGRAAIFDIPDIERIEVLRGPQGTLFGRNATSGAISMVTRDPTGKFGFRQDLTIGNYDQIRTRTSIDLPTVGPFTGYVTFVHDERDGDVRNLGAGTTFDRSSKYTDLGTSRSPNYLGGSNFENVFAAVRFAPGNGDFKITYKFDRSKGKFSQDARTVTAINTSSPEGALIQQIINAQPAGGGRYGPVILNPGDRRPDAYNNGWTGLSQMFVQGHNITTDWRVSDHLSLKNITGFRKSHITAPATVAGLDGLEFTSGAADAYASFAAAARGLPAALVPFIRTILQPQVGQYFAVYEGNNAGRQSQFSTELQANYNSSFMNLTVGALYYHSREFDSGIPEMAANFAFTPLPELLPLANSTNGYGLSNDLAKTRSIAAYAQADIHVTHKLDLQVGGRVTHDKKNTSYTGGGTFVGDRFGDGTIVFNPALPGDGTVSGVFKKTKPTYSVGLNYKPTGDTLLYIKTSTGFLSGGSTGNFAFKPETVTSYEAGAKTDLFDRRLRVNGAIWHAKYKNLQQPLSGATPGVDRPDLGVVVFNTGTLKAWGVELEVTAQPVRQVTLGGQLGYTHDKISNVNPVLLSGQSDYRYIGNPSLTGGVYGQYVTAPLFDQASMLFRIDANYQSKFRAINDPDVATNIPAFAPYKFSPQRWIVNTRVSLRDLAMGARAKGEIALWSRNLLNNRDSIFPFPFGRILFTNSYQRARTYGVDFTVRY